MAQEKILTIGQAMRFARKKAKIKQGELAKIIGHGQNAICRWENDKQTPLITAVIDIADALGITIDEVVGRKFKLKPVESFPFDCCPKCGRVINKTNCYCPDCGQALDWSDTK